MVEEVVVVRGGGDVATGVIQKLHRSGFKVLVLEVAKPMAIRRKVAICEAVYDGAAIVEDIKGILVNTKEAMKSAWNNGMVPIVVDPKGKWIKDIKPGIVVDAILAKKNLGTNKEMAPITIALGPGFTAGEDVDVVIETMRGHHLGRLIFKGKAIKNTGVPGIVAGYSKERVIHSPHSGIIKNMKEIGDQVTEGEVIASVENNEVVAKISGILRGIIQNHSYVRKGLKIADIDPRVLEKQSCFTISDKARNIGGAVLEAILIKKRSVIWKNKF